jgi:hypothetical protein
MSPASIFPEDKTCWRNALLLGLASSDANELKKQRGEP